MPAPLEVKVIRQLKEDQRIWQLVLPERVHLQMLKQGTEETAYVILKAHYPRPQNLLFLNQEWIKASYEGSPAYFIPINIEQEVSSFVLHSVGAGGEIEKEKVFLVAEHFEKLTKSELPVTKRRTWPIVSLGHKYIDYKQDGWELTGKQFSTLRVDWQLPRLKTYLYGHYAFRAYSGANSDYEFRQTQVHVLSGSHLPLPHFPWEVGLMGGAYYENYLSARDNFGYRDLIGWSAQSHLQYTFESKNQISVYGEFAYKKLGAGLKLLHLNKSNRPLMLSFDYERTKLLFAGRQIETRVYLLNLGLGL